MKNLVSLGRQTSIYLIANVFNASVPFLLIPYLTRVLNPEQYGTLGMFLIAIAVFSPFVGLAVHGAIIANYFQMKPEQHRVFVFNAFLILMILGLFVGGGIFLFHDFFESLFHIQSKWLFFSVLNIVAQFVINIKLSLLQVKKSAALYGFIQIIQSVLSALLTVGFIHFLLMGWEGRALSLTLANILVGFVCLVLMWKQNDFCARFDMSALKSICAFGVPLLPHTLGALVISYFDRWFVGKMLSLEAAGIYILGIQIGSVVGIVADAVNKSFGPWIMEKLSKENKHEDQEIVKWIYLGFISLLGLAVISSVSFYFLSDFLVGDKYSNSKGLAAIAIFANAFVGMYYLMSNFVFYYKKTVLLSYVTATVGGASILLNMALIHTYGVYGVASVFLASQAFMFVCTFILVSRFRPMPWLSFGRVS